MIDVKWGATGLKEQYISWLQKKWIAGVASVVIFTLGSFLWILKAYSGDFSTVYVIGLCLWMVGLLILSFGLTQINSRIHSIEIFLNFYQHRHEVRHEVFCTNHLHCVGLHYFKSYDD